MGSSRPSRSAISITRFSDSYRFLSNFYGCKVEFEGLSYPSVEHAYQAAKSLDRRDRYKIAAASTPNVAKKLGRKMPLRPGWDGIKQAVMLACLESKFSDPILAAKLISTHPSPLIEGNDWHDDYWGVSIFTGEGQNILGKLLQVVRENLRKQRRPISERREEKRQYFRAWRARRAAELKSANANKLSVPLPPLPELPWAWNKRKGSREPLKRTDPGRVRTK